MSSLKFLNRRIIQFILFLIILPTQAEEAIDIWNIENSSDKNNEKVIVEEMKEIETSIFQTIEPLVSNIKEDKNIENKKTNIFGLFDPEENNLNLNMWVNSEEEKILNKLKRIDALKLSNDSEDILFNTLFTNSYLPGKDKDSLIFLDYKSEWLIKNKKIKIIENYLLKNKNLKNQSILIEYLANDSLSVANIEEACEKIKFANSNYSSDYLNVFSIYCLINSNKIDEAQLQFDLLKENNFKNKFYEKKLKFLLGYLDKPDDLISDNSLLEFHLSYIVNSDFKYEPSKNTTKEIWLYLSAANLVYSSETVDTEDEEKINLIEQATAKDSYNSKELFNIYKRLTFNFNQFLDIENSYKSIPNYKARALLYQAALLSDNLDKKFILIKKLNDLFEKDNIGNAFLYEMKLMLSQINEKDVPENYLGFYNYYLNLDEEQESLKKIKFDNSVIHKSKLLKYFIDDDYKIENLPKDLNSVYKKIRKNKNYFFSIQDMIILESLKSDGLEIPKKIDKLYNLENLTIPENLITLNEQNEQGLFLLNIVELIGEDKFSDLDPESLYYIITILNKFNFKKLRNNIILKSLPQRI
jgi:hypothetical protein